MATEEVETEVGRVIKYVPSRLAAEVKLSGTLCKGDRIRIEGPRSNWKQSVELLYIDHEPVGKAEAGQIVWLGVIMRAHKGDKVFVIKPGDGDGPDVPDIPPDIPDVPETPPDIPDVPQGSRPRPKEKRRGMGG